MVRHTTPLLVLAILALLAPNAHAGDADRAACADKAEGDDCTRSDGYSGICMLDEGDSVLTCDDRAADDAAVQEEQEEQNEEDDDVDTACAVARGGGDLSFMGAALLVLVVSRLGARRRAGSP